MRLGNAIRPSAPGHGFQAAFMPNYPAGACGKPGPSLQCVTLCFAPLLRWVLSSRLALTPERGPDGRNASTRPPRKAPRTVTES